MSLIPVDQQGLLAIRTITVPATNHPALVDTIRVAAEPSRTAALLVAFAANHAAQGR